MTKNEKNRTDIAVLLKTQLPALLLFARQWSHDSSEDIVQEAFIKLIEQPKWPENIAAWLFAVVRNLSNNHVRGEKRRKNRENARFARNVQWFAIPDQEDESNENQSELIEQLQALPLKYREVIVAKIWGKLTFEEIAAMQNQSSSSVHRNYKAGLEILHKNLSEK